MRFVITGNHGQLGSELMRLLAESNTQHDVVALGLDLPECDIRSYTDCLDKLNECHKILGEDVAMIHTAAYTQVDTAETDVQWCTNVNVHGTKHLAELCRRFGWRFVYISTDYVFGGEHVHPLSERATPGPVGIYGWSKWKGEVIAAKLPDHCIIRTCGLYKHGPFHNFPNQIIEKVRRGERRIQVVCDRYCLATYVPHLAEAVLWLARQGRDAQGIWHVANSSVWSWAGFAAALLRELGWSHEVQIDPIPEMQRQPPIDYESTSLRPLRAILDTSQYDTVARLQGGPTMPIAEMGVRAFAKAWLNEFGNNEGNPLWKPPHGNQP